MSDLEISLCVVAYLYVMGAFVFYTVVCSAVKKREVTSVKSAVCFICVFWFIFGPAVCFKWQVKK